MLNYDLFDDAKGGTENSFLANQYYPCLPPRDVVVFWMPVGLAAESEKTASANAPVAATTATALERFIHVPKSRPTTAQKLNPLFWFGNMDDPVPPNRYRPSNRFRKFLWSCRNPLHNFFFYVVGIADKEFEIVGRVPGRISNPDGGWNWTVCKYKRLRLPLVAYKQGGFNFYLGWRNHGNLGMKLTYSKR